MGHQRGQTNPDLLEARLMFEADMLFHEEEALRASEEGDEDK
jgi:hypothetical protein